jgi:hypothetical protein
VERVVDGHIDEKRIAHYFLAILVHVLVVVITGARLIVVTILDTSDTISGTGAIELDLAEHQLDFLENQVSRGSDDEIRGHTIGCARHRGIGSERQLNGMPVGTRHVAGAGCESSDSCNAGQRLYVLY